MARQTYTPPAIWVDGKSVRVQNNIAATVRIICADRREKNKTRPQHLKLRTSVKKVRREITRQMRQFQQVQS